MAIFVLVLRQPFGVIAYERRGDIYLLADGSLDKLILVKFPRYRVPLSTVGSLGCHFPPVCRPKPNAYLPA